MKGFTQPNQLDGSIDKLYRKWIWKGAKENIEQFGYLAPVSFYRSPLQIGGIDSEFSLNIQGREFFANAQAYKNYTLLTVEIDNSDETGKQISAALIQTLRDKWKADFVAFVAEAWCKVADGNDIEKATLIPPRLDPDRKEVIVIDLFTPKGTWSATTPLLRDEQNRPYLPKYPTEPTLLKETMGRFVVKFD